LTGYNVSKLDDPIEYYYHRVYLGCVRANDVLVNHPMWDGETLVVCGGSQGGQLSMVVSALDKRVTGTVTNYPAYCDVTGYLHGRAGGWPHMFRGDQHRTEAKIQTTAYYDALNFARRLHAPISMAFGYNDVTCPPTSMQAAYNSIEVEKELHLQLEMGHRATSEFNANFTERILRMAGVRE
jgi:cephalosporin-C deacetylase